MNREKPVFKVSFFEKIQLKNLLVNSFCSKSVTKADHWFPIYSDDAPMYVSWVFILLGLMSLASFLFSYEFSFGIKAGYFVLLWIFLNFLFLISLAYGSAILKSVKYILLNFLLCFYPILNKYKWLIISDKDFKNLAKKYFEMFKLNRKILVLDFRFEFEKKFDQPLLIKYDDQAGFGVFFDKYLMSIIPYEVFQETLKTELKQLIERELKRLSEIAANEALVGRVRQENLQQAKRCRDSYPLSH